MVPGIQQDLVNVNAFPSRTHQLKHSMIHNVTILSKTIDIVFLGPFTENECVSGQGLMIQLKEAGLWDQMNLAKVTGLVLWQTWNSWPSLSLLPPSSSYINGHCD